MIVPDDAWLARFHAGDGEALEHCYREHFDDVRAAVGRVLRGADRDTVVHQVFYRLVSESALRANFRGGNLAAWLVRVSRNEAVDFCRKFGREELDAEARPSFDDSPASLESLDAKITVERFRRERLEPKLEPVFEARFLRQLSQREAAAVLGMQRSTLAYQEQQIREALRAFLLEEP